MPTFLTASEMKAKVEAAEKLGNRVSEISVTRRANLSAVLELDNGAGFELTPDEESKKNGDVPALGSIVAAYRKLVDADDTYKGRIAVKPNKATGVVLVSKIK